MNAKFYLLAALLGGIVLFAWGAVAHMAIPFWDDVMLQVPNEQAVVDALKSSGVSNGIYYGMQGMLLVTFFGHGMSDNAGMGSYMVAEFISDVLVALVLAWLLLRINVRGTLNRGFYAGIIGVFGWLSINVSSWIWYHYPLAYISLEAVDNVPGTFLAGLVIAWLMKKTKLAVA